MTDTTINQLLKDASKPERVYLFVGKGGPSLMFVDPKNAALYGPTLIPIDVPVGGPLAVAKAQAERSDAIGTEGE